MSPSKSNRRPPRGKSTPPPGRRPQGRATATTRSASNAPARATSSRVPWIIGAVVIAIAIAIAIAIIVAVTGGGSNSKPATTIDSQTPKYGRVAAPASLVQAVTTVPSAVYDKVGLGTGQLPQRIRDTASTTKPAILFIGAEFCPFCAAERWAIVNALSRFGTFTNLQITHSSAKDVYPNTETFSFYGSNYQSQYLSFDAVEMTTNEPSGSSYKTLQTPTQQQVDTWQKYTTGYPFLYLDGHFASVNAFDPGVLANKSHDEIAAALRDPNSLIAKAAIGTANGITAALCTLTNDQPSSACTVPTITDLAKQLHS